MILDSSQLVTDVFITLHIYFCFSWTPRSDKNKKPAFCIRRVALNCMQIKKEKSLPHISPLR